MQDHQTPETHAARPIFADRTEFGRMIGVSRQRVHLLIQSGLPTTPSGRIAVDDALAWLHVHANPRRRAGAKPDCPTWPEPTRQALLRAEREAREFGRLVPRNEIRQVRSR